ncbi:hypothetical protein MIND_00266600 [Mycena indigotica]|uniref:Transferase family protein n=1 Tax=Mycena indigotica TaxID=2126181 RepID=A0A8H6WF52_9AGAR|nr:uncharacterized protein MIND_00266600 [Mycena indigotica]KAF7312528.1 hypothetical protein MIND_00266600 [Mycena indigotica]
MEFPPAKCTPLSILDSSVGNFSATAAVWVYNGPSSLDSTSLQTALIKTLDVYPQWAGQIRCTKYNPSSGHTTRSRRLEVVYGTSNDPGVEFVVANTAEEVDSVFPSVEERTSTPTAWNATSLAALNLLPQSPALANGDVMGLPALVVQVTKFACGGIAIALKSSHPMADAQTLTTFVKDWAEMHRAITQNLPTPAITRHFVPSDVDNAAAGDIDAESADSNVLRRARELPIHRYDWWASSDDCPEFMLDSTRIPLYIKAGVDFTYGPPLPWAEWDHTQPISNYILHFSAAEIFRIWQAASVPGQVISRFDALQAHVWSVLIRAHQPKQGENFHLNLSLGVRERLVRPLREALGSPIVLARATATGESSLAELAHHLRETVTWFTPIRVSALLHEMAFDIDARRMWAGFIGSRNMIVTSWLRLGVYEVDFGAGRPRFVHSVMPALEGIVQVMEARPRMESGGPWYQDGASVSIMLPNSVWETFLVDQDLRKFA